MGARAACAWRDRTGRALADSLDAVGIACTCTICGCRGSAGRLSARPTTSKRCRTRGCWSALAHTVMFVAVTRQPRARGWSGAGAGVGERISRPRAGAHRHPAAVGHSDGGRGPDLALHVREPGRARHRGCSRRLGVAPPTWFADAFAAWIPLVLADVWKTTPFVALLLLAGLQNIDRVAV